MPLRKTIFKPYLLLLISLSAWLVLPSETDAQQVRFPPNNMVAQSTGNPWSTSPYPGTTSIPPSNSTAPWPSQSSSAPYGATIRPNTAPILPTAPGAVYPPTPSSVYPWTPSSVYPTTPGAYPPMANSWNLTNALQSLGIYGQPAPYSAYPTSPGAFPSSVYPNASPPVLYPYGLSSSPPAPTAYGSPYTGGVPPASPYPSLYGTTPLITSPLPSVTRFFVSPRFRARWIVGDDVSNSLGIHDFDSSLLFQKPQFLGCTQPLYIVPSFSLHLWDGPKNSVADLPAQAYSAFLDFGWETEPQRTFGTELGIRVGVFSEFDVYNGDSFRILGKALARIRLTPNKTGRLGVYWLDRNSIKLLPAFGILCTGNANSRFDLFFPEPKLSQYVSTVGKTDMWWYASGFLGGGTWTIQRSSGVDDSVDINDWRVVIGLEWGRNEMLRQGHRFAFLEAGYVFNRELIYRYNPNDNLDLENNFMLAAGFVY